MVSSTELVQFLHRRAVETPRQHVQYDERLVDQFIASHVPDALTVLVQNDQISLINHLADADLAAIEHVLIVFKDENPVSSLDQLNLLTVAVENATSGDILTKIRAILGLGLLPMFEFSGHRSDDNIVENSRRKFNELSLSLQNMQTRVQAPDLVSSTHPEIAKFDTEVDDFDKSVLDDPVVLNEVTTIVNGWIKQINNVTSSDSNLATQVSLADEIQFWTNLQICLESLESQLASPQVKNSLNFLNRAKRFHITLSFTNDTNIGTKSAETKLNLSMIKEIPLEKLDSVDYKDPDWPLKFGNAINDIFQPLKRIRNLTNFPLQKALLLIELALRDTTTRIINILRKQGVLYMELAEFTSLHQSINTHIFDVLDLNVKSMVNLIRELLRKRQEKFFLVRVDQTDVENVKEKLTHIQDLKVNYETTLQITRAFLLDTTHEAKFQDAFNRLCFCDPLDFSSHAAALWASNEKVYNKTLVNTQNLIRDKLNALFKSCKTFDQYVFISSKYKNLSTSFDIATLIQEDLALAILDAAKTELESMNKIASSEGESLIRNIDVSDGHGLNQNRIAWMLSINSRMDYYNDQLDELIGAQWRKFGLGERIEELVGQIRALADVNSFFNTLIEDISSTNIVEVRGKVLKLVVSNETNDILINFDRRIILNKQLLDYLVLAGFEIPVTVSLQFSRLNKIFPLIIELASSLDTLKYIFQQEEKKLYFDRFAFLIAEDMKQLSEALVSLSLIHWEHVSQAMEMEELEANDHLIEARSFKQVQLFITLTGKFIDHLNSISEVDYRLNTEIYYGLRKTAYSYDSFKTILDYATEKIQALNSVTSWAQLKAAVQEEASSIIYQRCKAEIIGFIHTLEVAAGGAGSPLKVSVKVQTNLLMMEPSPDEIRQSMIARLNDIVAVIKKQNIPHTKFLDATIQNDIIKALECINHQGSKVASLLRKWQTILDLISLDLKSPSDLKKIGVDDKSGLEHWLGSLNSTVELGELFDSDELQISDLLHVNCSKVISKLESGFHRFQNELIDLFCKKLNLTIGNFLEAINVSIKKVSFTTIDSNNIIEDLGAYYEADGKLNNEWAKLLELCNLGSDKIRLLLHRFPANWIYVEQLESRLSILVSLLTKKKEILQENRQMFQARVASESSERRDMVSKFRNDWNTRKPVSGDLEPLMALNLLNKFAASCAEHQRAADKIVLISSSLDVSVDRDHLEVLDLIRAEIEDFKSVWTAIYTLHDQIQRLRKLSWASVVSRDLRQKLEDIWNESRSLPIRVRQYSAFEEIQQTTKNLIKYHKYILDLRNDSLKPRHWKRLLTTMGRENMNYDSLLLGDIWDMNFQLNENVVKSIVTQANNEQVLEETINKIKDKWRNTMFVFYNYNSKYKLVRSWDEIFTNCVQDLNELASMKTSSSYSTFEQEVILLENKLNQLHTLLDSWIEMQREWVYLDGVFGKSTSISSLLPVESARFNNLSLEFLGLLQKIHKLEVVIDVILIPDIDPAVDRLLDSLAKLRGSLSEYLERQRAIFPRFYFLGNEDLLELMGSGIDFVRINKHISRLFPNISSVNFDTNSNSIISFTGIEHETVALHAPVSLIQHEMLHEWLKELGYQIKYTISALVTSNLKSINNLYKEFNGAILVQLIQEVPCQVMILCCQIWLTRILDQWRDQKLASDSLENVKGMLNGIGSLTSSLAPYDRKRMESLTVELIHQRDILSAAAESTNFQQVLTRELMYYHDERSPPLDAIMVKQHKSQIRYGFEYMGIPEKLVYTPLISNCFLAMTQALGMKMGGSPFGPAGTGKTESIKALGASLGKTVIVFCCDQTFDFQSMSRIFLGLCKLGCWGCFDEFNRLEESILSAVSSQIEAIELGLKKPHSQIELSGKKVRVNPETGIFVTMNPGYVGRNELPENLKKLFRSFSMEKPDSEQIVEVLLFSQGFKEASNLATKIVPFYSQLANKCSAQDHYDFGLRSLKSMLANCGKLKRRVDKSIDDTTVVLKSIRETILPKLIREDEMIFEELVHQFFGSHPENTSSIDEELWTEVTQLGISKGISMSTRWLRKIQQLFAIQENHHGVMLVGSAGSGKTTSWKLLLEGLRQYEQTEFVSYVIDAKVLSKKEIYGHLDPLTREWTDGRFTRILRSIKHNLRGEKSRRTWVIFDGDIDPEWAENLNSVLDDNKILTLPNGERLDLPENVKIVFETDNLAHTSLATISRCGMVWYDESLIRTGELYEKALFDLSSQVASAGTIFEGDVDSLHSEFVYCIRKTLDNEAFEAIVDHARSLDHIMDFSLHRYLSSFVDFVRSYMIRLYDQYKTQEYNLNQYATRSVLLSIIWSFAGDCGIEERKMFSEVVCGILHLQGSQNMAVSSDIDINGDWKLWNSHVQTPELEPDQVSKPNVVVPTTDTVRLESIIRALVVQGKPLLLCGPPGSGKTMTFLNVLNSMPGYDVVHMNFSKDTSPSSLIDALNQHCEYRKYSNSVVFSPKISSKHVVVFCDEINLPGPDKYGCQKVISFMRQLVEQEGFWASRGQQWVTIKNVHFVGACNSPKDPGRHRLTERFARHTNVIMVDYPEAESLNQIYSTFNRAIMKCVPDLRGYTESLTAAMLMVYESSKEYLLPAKQAHYIYSPRELTRWSRGLLAALKSSSCDSLEGLVRLWYHEGSRLFGDRLVGQEDRAWTEKLFHSAVKTYFPYTDEAALRKPILYSDWLTSQYEELKQEDLLKFVLHRLSVFSDEESTAELVFNDDLLDHCLRIDRVLRQKQGHMILVGPASSGKTTLSKFVAWMNGLKIVQLDVSSNYGIKAFDKTLRSILLRCAKGEQICFLIDESSIMETSFIERMNTLLANSEIPGLFEHDEYKELMKVCLAESQSRGMLLDSDDELYDWFSAQISSNLHVIFNLTGLRNNDKVQVITSPALFNRCVVSYMGDWSLNSLVQVGLKTIENVPLDVANHTIPEDFVPNVEFPITNLKTMLVENFIYFHRTFEPPIGHKSPGHYMKLLKKFVDIFTSKKIALEDTQRHTTNGLNKLRETVLQVTKLKAELSDKKELLAIKDKEAREMLNKMLSEQNEAERKQEFSIVAQEELSKQEAEIDKRRAKVLEDLRLAEPGILEARKGVQNIKKQHLSEIRSMLNPPNAVKMTMESVCILLGYEVSTWRDVQAAIRKDDFVTSIVSYDSETQLTEKVREVMKQMYLSREDYTFEVVNRASKACGPLLQWVKAQLLYADVVERIAPLRDEVYLLEKGARKTKAQLSALKDMVVELEESIEKYKNDYSDLIRDSEGIKIEMSSVEEKVTKSSKLLESLTTEKDRWLSSVSKFADHARNLVGESLLAAASIVYLGMFDQRNREKLFKTWKIHTRQSGIYSSEVTFLSLFPTVALQSEKPEELGEVVLENFVIMRHCDVPLIIDPTQTFDNYLPALVGDKKYVVTSFLREGFVNEMKNAIRFGGAIVVEDCEYYDPIIDGVLRREIYRNGGRLMVRVGDQQVDYNPEFRLILRTQDPHIVISPFVFSRVSVINFTITSASLESYILNLSLSKTEPEVEEKRANLMSMQTTFKAKLKDLEVKLLNSLSEVSGSILDNDEVMEFLAQLKRESKQIDIEMEEASKVMATVEQVRNKFCDVAVHCCGIYNVLKKMSTLSLFYTFPLSRLIEAFLKCLRDTNDMDISKLIENIYMEVYSVISPSLSRLHNCAFAFNLAEAYYSLDIGEHYHKFARALLSAIVDEKCSERMPMILQTILLDYAGQTTAEIAALIQDNSEIPTLKILKDVLTSVYELDNDAGVFLDSMAGVSSFLFSGVGSYSSKYSIETFVEETHDTATPILLTSQEGFDGSLRIEQLAAELAREVAVVALGSQEGVDLANKQIRHANATGGWVVIQNIQMSPMWLATLEKTLQSMKPKDGFQLFLTCTFSSHIPVSLVSMSRVVAYENQSKLRDILLETFDYYDVEFLDTKPPEYRQAYFLVVWFHSIIIHRLDYAPVSFKKVYDFNDSDYVSALKVLDQVMEPLMANGASNVAPDSIPWTELQYVLSEVTYGGKVDHKEDLEFIREFSSTLFSIHSFEIDFNLIRNKVTSATKETLHKPEGLSSANYRQWISEIPDQTPLSWIALEADADKMLKHNEAMQLALYSHQLLQ